jgi:hypothetical protein
VKAVLYADRQGDAALAALTGGRSTLCFRKIEYHRYDSFIRTLEGERFDMALVLADGAAGMIAAKTLCPETPAARV